MDSVMVNREKLLETVRVNRETHKRIADEARDGYREKLLERLEELRTKAESEPYNKILNLSIGLPPPQDHTKEYDTVISMLEYSVDEEIEITQYDFQQYVLDEWSWKQGFTATNSVYVASLNGS